MSRKARQVALELLEGWNFHLFVVTADKQEEVPILHV